MGTTLTTKHRLIKPDDNESIDVNQLNDNWDTIDENMLDAIHNSIPEGKTPKSWTGWVATSKGAGGDDKEAKNATDIYGIGALWFGRDIPVEFEGLSSAFIQQQVGNVTGDLNAYWIINMLTTTKLKFQGRRRNDLFAASYPTVAFYVTVNGW